jgi:RepB DNA-primase from phage plasmid
VSRFRFTSSNDTSDRWLPYAFENVFEDVLTFDINAGISGNDLNRWKVNPQTGRGPPRPECVFLEDCVVIDRGLALSLRAIQRQLAAMPCELYLVRLIHQPTRRPFPGKRLWTAAQLTDLAAVRFLRIRNREGCDIYMHPWAEDHNAGYILIDLDRADPAVLEIMRARGHHPCVVLQSSPGHLQAWIRLSRLPLPPAAATAAARQLARWYGGDTASADWRHLGRLAGFTNQKPARRTPGGHAPWVKIVHAHVVVAPQAEALLESVMSSAPAGLSSEGTNRADHQTRSEAPAPSLSTAQATAIYQDCVQRWRIAQRFAPPDWNIVDLWIARHLLQRGTPAAEVEAILQLASPQFPRRHGNPHDYLRRTVARAAFPFPAPGRAVCAAQAHTAAAVPSARSNSTGGR